MNLNPVDRVLAWAETTPTMPAIRSTDLIMTFGDLGDTVRRVAAKLQQLGVRQGSVVGVGARPELEAVLMIALLHLGAVSLHASASVLAAHGTKLDFLVGDRVGHERTAARVITVDPEFFVSLGSVNPRIEAATLTGGSPCRIVFSSGTTGSPKGVEFSVDALTARTASARANWMPADPFMCLLGLDTVSGFQTFMWAVLNGRTWFAPADGPANLALIREAGVRSIKTSPARLENLLDAVEASPGPSPLSHIEVAGSLLTPTVGRRCVHVLGTPPIYLYGSTEVGTVTRGVYDPERPAAVGRVVADASVQVVDEEGADLSGSGSQGVIRFRTAHTSDHYWRSTPDIDRPFRNGWFYPGDRGALLDDGSLVISGRTDDVINAGGAKFNLTELDVWMSQLDLFTDSASFQFRDANGAVAIGVGFVSRNILNLDMVVARIHGLVSNLDVRALARVEQIPRNHLGKVDRMALAALMENQ